MGVIVVQAGPDELRVQNADYGDEGNIGDVFSLPVPTGAQLRRV